MANLDGELPFAAAARASRPHHESGHAAENHDQGPFDRHYGREPDFRCICKVKGSPWKSGHQSFVVFTESQLQLQDEARFDRQPERETGGLTSAVH